MKTTLESGIYPLKPRQALWIKFTVPASTDSERWVLVAGCWVLGAGDTVPGTGSRITFYPHAFRAID
ncbi:MAG: hypothetical protein HQ446_08090 [Polaromonas sp.]|nr:hypothetical protein [Polaromonas sp.]